MGEYFNYPYEEAVGLLKQLVASKAIEQEKDKRQEPPLLPMDYFDRIQMLVTEKSLREKSNITLKVFMESLRINYDAFFEERKKKIMLLEDAVEIAKALGVTVEYLISGESDKPDTTPIIQRLESTLEELRRL
jgi:hypothetical protein